MTTPPFAFVSYCRDNASDVSEIITKLNGAGFDVRWDQLIPKGANWKTWVRREIEGCRAFIICLSQEVTSRNETQIFRELSWAIEASKSRSPVQQFFFPCRISECPIPDVEIGFGQRLSDINWIDLFPRGTRNGRLDELIQALEAIRGKTPAVDFSPTTQSRAQAPESMLWCLADPRRLHICVSASGGIDTGLYIRPVTGIGQLKGLAQLLRSLHKAYDNVNEEDDLAFCSNELCIAQHQRDYILLGSRKTNEQTGKLLDRLNDLFALNRRIASRPPFLRVDTELTLTKDGTEDCVIVLTPHRGTRKEFRAKVDPKKRRVVHDYGLIIRVPNPFAQPRLATAAVFAGAHTYGTLGAVKWFTAKYADAERDGLGSPSAALLAVVRCSVEDDGSVGEIQLVEKHVFETRDFNWVLPLPKTDRLEEVERRLVGKTGKQKSCEDRIVATQHFAAVIDGATSQSGLRWGGKSGGQAAAEAIVEAIKELPWDADRTTAVRSLNESILNLYRKHGHFEAAKSNAVDRASACLVLYSRHYRECWLIGDCQGMSIARGGKTHRFDNHKIVDDVNASARAFYNASELARGAKESSLQAHDVGREFITELLIRQREFQNSPRRSSYNHWVLDGFLRLDDEVAESEVVRTVRVPDDVVYLVLASDGYPLLLATADETEKHLTEIIGADPLLIGRYRGFKSTKGVVAGNVSYDDRAFLKIKIGED
jgi:hypothetical protein